ncbi:MAG: UPF0158 family protein [Solirubrobacterales bacterium]
MLDLDKLDLSDLCIALEDHSSLNGWLLDPRAGKTYPAPESSLEDAWEFDIDPEELIAIDPVPSYESYGDLEDFTAEVQNSKARDLLERAIAGRGAFRRFKDTLFEFPELREAWFKFHDVRMERRAIEWLLQQELVDPAHAEAALAERVDPQLPEASEPLDAQGVAQAVAADLRRLYGERLRRVALFGSWARGDAHPDSDIDLLVVLDHVDSPWEEHRRMDDILWTNSLRSDSVISASVASEDQLRSPSTPAMITAMSEGRTID